MYATLMHFSDVILIVLTVVIFVVGEFLSGFIRLRDVGDLWHVQQRHPDEE
jgi:hypothetical protein